MESATGSKTPRKSPSWSGRMEHLPAREGVEVEKPAAARENRLNKPTVAGLEYEVLLAIRWGQVLGTPHPRCCKAVKCQSYQRPEAQSPTSARFVLAQNEHPLVPRAWLKAGGRRWQPVDRVGCEVSSTLGTRRFAGGKESLSTAFGRMWPLEAADRRAHVRD